MNTDTVSQLVKDLAIGIMNAKLYFADHVRVKGSADQIMGHVRQLQKEEVQFPVNLGVSGGRIIFQGKPLVGASLYAKRFATAVQDRKAGGIRIDGEVRENEVTHLLATLARLPRAARTLHEMNRDLELAGITHITFIQALTEVNDLAERTVLDKLEGLRNISVPLKLYQNLTDLLQTTTIRVVKNIGIEMDRVYDTSVQVMDMLRRDPVSLLTVSTYEESEDFTVRHSMRVCLRSSLFASTLTRDENLQLRICRAALLHDIGKALVPQEIVYKTGPLTPMEKDEMNQHTTYGARLLLEHENPDPLSIHVALSHHCQYDRGGYPRLPGTYTLSPITSLIQICDVFEALTARRPYKDALHPRRALEVIYKEKERYHPELLAHFIKFTGIYPPGSIVELTTGEQAVVLAGSRRLEKPFIRLLADNSGELMPMDNRREVDLSAGEDIGVRRLVRTPDLLEGLLSE